MYTGNKMFNEYEVLAELGRGEHGKVKLARDLKRQKHVAIKIVQRFSRQRRLARLGQPEEKVKKDSNGWWSGEQYNSSDSTE